MSTLEMDFAEAEQERKPRVYCDSLTGLTYVPLECVPTTPFHSNQVISLFSGAGGLDIGLEAAGFQTAVCVEVERDCRETLAYNRPAWRLATGQCTNAPGDIRNLSGQEILEVAGLKRGEAALVVGGPPCQPFSNIGKKQGVSDPLHGDLASEFLRVVQECSPQGIIFENVEGLRQVKHRPLLDHLTHALQEAGYTTAYTVLNAADYGVPQQRRRFILLGLRQDKTPAFPFPTHFQNEAAQRDFAYRVQCWTRLPFRPWRTVGEAFAELSPEERHRSDFALMNISPLVRHRMTFLRQGENFKALPLELRPDCWKNGKHQGQDTFGRLREERPSVTIRTAAYNPAKGMYIHPTEDRGLSSHEMATLQSFPSDWVFRCADRERVTLVSVGRQIGNAVPPRLAQAIGLAMKAALME